MNLTQRLCHPDASCLPQEPLAPYAHFGLGGPAEYLVIPRSPAAAIHTAKVCLEAGRPLYVLGQLSNVLISDEGLPGVTMLMTQAVGQVKVDGLTVTADAGIWLSRLAAVAAAHGLSGLEFACGIPGTLGGSILINAGAYDHQFSDIVLETTYLAEDGSIRTRCGDEHRFGYRTSFFETNGGLILQSRFGLARTTHDIYGRMAELARKRRDSQPLAARSCGSAFKRPPGHFAGKLIADAGLKGYEKNGAGVSDKHAGFIVNRAATRASDVADVFNYVQEIVFAASGIRLEPEVRFGGRFDRLPLHAHTLKPIFGGE